MDDFEKSITVERLQETGEMLSVLGDAFGSITMLDDQLERQRVEIRLINSYLNSVVTELALSIAEGRDVYDAMRYVVRGERKLDPEMSELFTKLQQDIKNPMKKN